LRPRQPTTSEGDAQADQVTYLLTTHSPHIASVTPIESLILLRKDTRENATVGASGATIGLAEDERDDIERYLDVSRAEGLFARGILLVEGEAERFLLPLLATRAGYDLDSLGITVCSVSGTNFGPYVRFFGPQGLSVPLAILTDLDPSDPGEGASQDYGRSRAHSLSHLMNPNLRLPKAVQEAAFYEKYGIFLNNSTLEIELYESGCIYSMNAAMQALCDVAAARVRFQTLADNDKKGKSPNQLDDPKRFLDDIEYVGKGRFAQRLCAEIFRIDPKRDVCPPYILKAIKHVI
jgi:putative ATP-dependent endonuclease of OLD family